MNNIYKSPIIIIFFYLLTTLPALALNKGERVPDIFGKTTAGKLFLLSSEKKRPRLLTFFSIKCKPCKKELPELAKLEKKFSKISFVSIHTDDYSTEKVKEFVGRLPRIPDTIVCSGKIVKREYGFRGFPYSVLVDLNLNVVEQFIGYSPANMKRLEELLSKF